VISLRAYRGIGMDARARFAARLGFSIAAVALVTGVVFALRPLAPVLSLGVLYVLAVVAVAVSCGLAFAVPVSLASMLTFNFLFLEPVHTLALRESENWVALAVYLVVGVVVAELATRSRRFARQAVDAAALRQSDVLKTAILRSVSHDLRSPLTAIRASAEGLANDDVMLRESERAELLDAIRLEVRRLERLVENLLDLSRLEAGPARRRPELWTVDALLERTLDEVGPEADRVLVRLAPDLPPVRVDAAQVERALVNVLENALKFSSPADPVEITAAAGAGRVVVRVRDHGPGVVDADRSRIFEPFERGATTAIGSGLGLAIARGFAEANGGTVRVERADGGATFAVELPAALERPAVAR
jgi:two-component system sensor histidine kinase KdpD